MTNQPLRYLSFVEALAFSACVAWYIWQLQESLRFSWIVFPIWLVGSFVLHKDTPQSLGWRADNLRNSLKYSAAVFLPCFVTLVIVGLFLGAFHRSTFPLLVPRHFLSYMAFCLLQQVGLNSMVTNRLLAATNSPIRAALLAGTLFALLHWPNPVLVPLTGIGGALMSWLFAKERNILSLTVWQAILGTAVWWAFPVAWHHAMRVGPGFYRFQLH
ncbi:MAG TPA: CPBP family intramembrane glutamic endopeptidase [Candidatus Angelobacter sp.]|nr:CPBP family intramembrane glutamic endopeptidase [Candidatus Angelobacter sp.]